MGKQGQILAWEVEKRIQGKAFSITEGKERKDEVSRIGFILVYTFYNEEFPSDDFSFRRGGPHNI